MNMNREGTGGDDVSPLSPLQLMQVLQSLRGGGTGSSGPGVFVTAAPPTEDDFDFSTPPALARRCTGVTILARTAVMMAQLWSRWGEPAIAVRLLEFTLRDTSSKRRHEVAKAAIVADHVARLERTDSLRAMEQQAQLDQLQAKLASKRNKRTASSVPESPRNGTGTVVPTSTSPHSCASHHESFVATVPLRSVRSELESFQWLRNFTPDVPTAADKGDVEGEVEVAAVREWLQQGALEDEDLIRHQRVNTLNCMAQVWRSVGDSKGMANSAFFCHKALAEQLLCPVDSYAPLEWVDACLALCDWYLLARDLSHVESCVLAIIKFTADRNMTPSPAQQASIKYYEAAFCGCILQLFQRSNGRRQHSTATAAAVSEQLFNNELLPPVDCRSGSVEAESRNKAIGRHEQNSGGGNDVTGGGGGQDSLVPWSIPERVPFLGFGLPTPRVTIAVPLVGEPGAKEDVLTWYSRFEAAQAEALRGITLDASCELYLELQRLTADVLCVLFEFDDDDEGRRQSWMEKRLCVLKTILSLDLNANAFRNVLRQAQYDAGGACMALGRGALKSTKAQNHCSSSSSATAATASRYFEQAKGFYSDFVAAFDAEQAQAQAIKKSTEDMFDESDYPAYILGLLQVAMADFMCGRCCMDDAALAERRKSATVSLRRCRDFIALHRKLLAASYPDTLAYDEQCQELLTFLGFDQSPQSSTGAAPALVAPLRGQFVDAAAVAPRPLAAAKRILAKPSARKL